MKLIIEGDSSKMIDNFTKVMFEITMQRIKEGKMDFNEVLKYDKKTA